MTLLPALLALLAAPPASAQQPDWKAFFDGARPAPSAVFAPAPKAAPAGAAALSARQKAEVDAELDAAGRAAAAWRGYDALAKPLLLWSPDGQAVLIGQPKPVAGFSQGSYRGRPLAAASGYPDPGFDFRMNQDVGGSPTTIISEREGAPQDHAALFVHERFHDYQRAWRRGGGYSDYLLEDPEDIAAAQLEQEALADALDAPSPRAALERFAALRRWRYARHPEIAGAEAWQERAEGTARYVELAAAPSAKGNTRPLQADLRAPLRLEDMAKTRLYSTGAAMGRLLDGLAVAWQGQVEGGRSPFEVLDAALALDDARAQALAGAQLSRPEYAKALARAQASVAKFVAERRAALERFERSAGVKVVLPLAWDGPDVPDVNFSGQAWYRFPGGGNLYDPAEVYLVHWRGLALRIEDKPVMESGSGAPTFFLDPAALSVDGRPWKAVPGELSFSKLAASQPGVELSMGRGRLSYDGKTLTLRVGR